MDLVTENRIASMLMKEAAELRRQADKEGVHAYLGQPNVRGRPNSRFLTATVLGVQQANRVVEVNEMWKVRQKELELDGKLKGRSRDKRSAGCNEFPTSSNGSRFIETSKSDHELWASSKQEVYSNEGGLRDEEVEEFLHSRVKRGRGAVGSRMDEAGPYLPLESKRKFGSSPDRWVKEERGHRVLGPEKPSYLKSHESSEDEPEENCRKKAKMGDPMSSEKSYISSEDESDENSRKKAKKVKLASSKKQCSKKDKHRNKKRTQKKYVK
ncbi:hypothetical protein GIB67_040678 [Kingdonia uniflora]|uniref:Uncharacterized protein n=1 Tax=Kingdonia uniflora TaxID=39325 RepID=A0A7J7KUB7_9MAGN|nr:hypothetical protein GIB67_040678 [Kingdonia uniflora]